jgi:hypothetical protein
MKYYRFEVKFTGYETVSVEADSEEAAAAKVEEQFEATLRDLLAWELRDKSVELTPLGESKY